MFSGQIRKPDPYTTATGGTGSLALLMDALKGVGEGGANISRQAGTSVAQDRLAAMTPEDRAGKGVLDKLQGLALTDQFRKRLEQGEADATKAEAVGAKEAFTTGRDKTLHGYNLERDAKKSAQTLSALKAGANEQTPEQNIESEKAVNAYNQQIMKYETAISANDTQDGI